MIWPCRNNISNKKWEEKKETKSIGDKACSLIYRYYLRVKVDHLKLTNRISLSTFNIMYIKAKNKTSNIKLEGKGQVRVKKQIPLLLMVKPNGRF